MPDSIRSVLLLLALLNPFLVIVYLLDAVETLDRLTFSRVLLRAVLIAGVIFSCFAVAGDVIFSSIIQAEFASFQIFGGVVFLLIGLQFVFRGPTAIEIVRGESKYLAGAIAMPVLIGPGTLSASVIIGKRLSPLAACGAIIIALIISVAVMILLKSLYDYVRTAHEELVQRYIEIAGRVTALYVGTVSVEMIM
ncbi:MAG: MarC family protein, partial [Planctomycetaceae bacterium]|nr:MarC family protein [Planctomycetaceae bacterium]